MYLLLKDNHFNVLETVEPPCHTFQQQKQGVQSDWFELKTREACDQGNTDPEHASLEGTRVKRKELTKRLAEVAEHELNEFVKSSPSYIQDTTDFLKKLSEVQQPLQEGTILF